MSKLHEADLHLLYVMEISFTIAPMESHTMPVHVLPTLEKSAFNKLNNMVYEINASEPAIKVKAHIMNGTAAPCITEKAFKLNCDLIVMGSYGTSGITEFLMGSTVYSVIKSTLIPVLTVPGTKEVMSFKQILFPVRATQGVMNKYDFLEPIIEKNKARLLIAALSLPGEIVNRNSLDDDISKLVATLKTSGTDFKSYFYVCANYAKKLFELSEQTKADLIVINATLDYEWKDFFIGPYTQQVVNHSTIPVLSIRTTAPSSLTHEHIIPINKARLAL